MQLRSQGFAIIGEIASTSEMLLVADRLGRILRAPSGEVVKELTVRDRHESRPGSLSARYGRRAFPFHTDTAFWSVPCRFIVMRVVGDMRRSTLLLEFESLWAALGQGVRQDALRSVWRVARERGGIYCSMRFGAQGRHGWRYDAEVMKPANDAAVRIANLLSTVFHAPEDFLSVAWSANSCLVVDNWRLLHARAAEPPQEEERQLFRIYVE